MTTLYPRSGAGLWLIPATATVVRLCGERSAGQPARTNPEPGAVWPRHALAASPGRRAHGWSAA